jgi:hypothetical protein
MKFAKILLAAAVVMLGLSAIINLDALTTTVVQAQRAELQYILGHDRAQQAMRPGVRNSFTAQTATGATSAFVADAGVLNVHNSQLIVTGGPAGCTYRLQGSNDGGTTWYNISASDITCTSTTNSVTVDVPAPRIRGNLLTLSGGTAPTVTLHYAGVQR